MGSKSRIIVKNIPKYATEDMVKKHFGKLPGVTITDVKVMKTPTGASRKFCFIGFTAEGEALRAVEYFNKSYFDTSKMEVSVALEVGSTELPRAWSKYSKKEVAESATKVVPSKRPVKDNEQRVNDFLASLEAPKKPMIWENDDAEGVEIKAKASKTVAEDESESDYDENYRMQQNESQVKDSSEEAAKKSPEEGESSEEVKKEEQIESAIDVDDKRLFIRNLPFTCTKEDLEGLFSPYGTINQIHIPLSRESKFPKGIAFVGFVDAQSALAAYENIDGSIFQGRLIHVMPANKQQQSTITEDSENKLEKRDAKNLKAKEAAPHNPIFLQESNVADSLAVMLGLSKDSILDDSGSSGALAVRVAVAEASMVASQKKYLEDAGVDMQVLEKTYPDMRRSLTSLFCKNLPNGVQEEELARTLGKYGKLSRLVFPRNSFLAICEYVDASEARKAYRSLLGSNFHSQPLLLSWAPEGIFKDTNSNAPIIKAKGEISSAQTESTATSSFCLFVKNLSFHTSEETLRDLFVRQAGKVRSVKIPKKKKSIKGDTVQSMGFGFVEFETSEACKLAIDKLQGVALDGHQLDLSFSYPKTDAAPVVSKKAIISKPPNSKATRLLVKNVPFEATEKELRELFASFVQIKKVRLPKKFSGQHRGFAFVDCATHQEACDAFSLLGSTHLYGRHLVIEWALDQGATVPGNDDELMIYE